MRLSTLPLLALMALLFLRCGGFTKEETLAKRYCGSCHLFPDPSLLDKKTWKSGVLPEMAFRMGMDISKLPGDNPGELQEILKAIPPQPLIPENEWNIIKAYYVDNAPESLSVPPTDEPELLERFSPEQLSLTIEPLITLLQWDSVDLKLMAGTRTGKLYSLDRNFRITDSLQLPSPPADIIFRPGNSPLIVCMGIMDPNDMPIGEVIDLTLGKPEIRMVADSIKRPVDIAQGDLNNDGMEDLVVSAFGNFTGALEAFERTGDGYRRHTLHNIPGTRKTVIRDFNNDGLPDILALITQGDEQIGLFTNRGNFRFHYKILLKFPPVYGSSYFDLADFNGDGHPDILYTNGDNADYSPILKPYHGVRIFLNDGKNQFHESWFHPMPGASRAVAIDFDRDGDLDIAAISFFPDFLSSPENSFLFLENNNGKFMPYITPLASTGRWITMEAADIDQDNDMDLILGALNFPKAVPDSLYRDWAAHKRPLLVLRNNLTEATEKTGHGN